MRVKDIEEFQSPRRRPWLLIGTVALLAVLLLSRYCAHRSRRVYDVGVAETGGGELPLTVPDGQGDPATNAPPAVSVSPTAPVLSDAEFKLRMDSARGLQESGRLAEARAAYLALLKTRLAPDRRADIETRLGVVDITLVTTPAPMPEKVEHTVRPGESVERIARKYGATIEQVCRGNQLSNPNLIKVGDRFRVLTGTFTIEISRSRRELLLRLNGEFFKRYRVGTGKYDKTPLGTFVISDRQVNPVWWRPDGKEIPFGNPENILGTRWMALRATGDTPDVRGYGIHGTWDTASIGKAESAGCIRMLNADVEELFSLVPLKTAVTIAP